jgi:hypothetical protein
MIDPQIVRDIQSGHIGSVHTWLSNLVRRWMEAGCIAHANQLLSLLLDAGFAERHITRSFEILWAMTDTRPVRLSPPEASLEEIESATWRMFSLNTYADAYVNRIKNSAIESLSDADLIRRIMITAYDESRPGCIAAPERLANASAAFERLFASRPQDSSHAVWWFEAWMARVLFAAQRDDLEQVKTYLAEMAREGHIVSPLMSRREIARIILDGFLAPVLGITPQQCEEDLNVLERAVRERLSRGPQQLHANLTWRQLLEIIIENEGRKVTRPAAGEDTIVNAERRLGVTLPQSYRSFLLATNGLKGVGQLGVEIWPVGKIGWAEKREQQLLQILDEFDSAGDDLASMVRKSIVIGSVPDGPVRVLLIPADDGKAEWQCWFFTLELSEEFKYPTFRAFVEALLRFP